MKLLLWKVSARHADKKASSVFITARCGCIVAHDIGPHQLERLVELLTPQECQDLLRTLSQPEENIFQHIDKLSPENNQLRTPSRAKREAPSSAAGKESFRDRVPGEWQMFQEQLKTMVHVDYLEIPLL